MNTDTTYSISDFNIERKGIQHLQKQFKNTAKDAALLSGSCFLSLTLPDSFSTLYYFTSSWGQELVEQHETITETFTFLNTKGRCSAESAPFFTLSSDTRHIDFAICTSGNYKVTVIPKAGEIQLFIGDAADEFSTLVPPGDTYCFPRILAHVYSTMEECYQEKQQYAKTRLMQHPVYETLPVIYNHWWAYEDCKISEDIILENARIAKELGVEMLVLDAGWFGNDSLSEEWYLVRGDWNLVNKERFPHGLSYLKEQIEALGLKFGIWCEIEGLGLNARLASEHPEYIAFRDEENLGYVCFGNPDVQEWAYQTMAALFKQCSAAYWKLDFNLDPGLGCNAQNHGHGSLDGLHSHYEGLYCVLDRLRETYPQLVIENCSSGGQRLNLEMAEHTHIHFLSDPDYSTHQMRLFKEASKWLLPKQILHFMWSNTVTTNGSAPFDNLNLDELSAHEIRYHMRLAMLHQFGISHRLIDYQPETLAQIKEHLTQYKTQFRSFVSGGNYLPLYLSKHLNIFSFSMDDRVLIFLFAETAGQAEYDLSPVLEPLTTYRLTDLDENVSKILCNPVDLKQVFESDGDWRSKLLLIETV